MSVVRRYTRLHRLQNSHPTSSTTYASCPAMQFPSRVINSTAQKRRTLGRSCCPVAWVASIINTTCMIVARAPWRHKNTAGERRGRATAADWLGIGGRRWMATLLIKRRTFATFDCNATTQIAPRWSIFVYSVRRRYIDHIWIIVYLHGVPITTRTNHCWKGCSIDSLDYFPTSESYHMKTDLITWNRGPWKKEDIVQI